MSHTHRALNPAQGCTQSKSGGLPGSAFDSCAISTGLRRCVRFYGNKATATSAPKPSQDKINKDLFLDVLKATATKREANSYLSRYAPKRTEHERLAPRSTSRSAAQSGVGVNLGALYPSIRSVEERPVSTQTQPKSTFCDRSAKPLRVASVKIKFRNPVNEWILKGVGHTLSQLTLPGLSCVVVVDPPSDLMLEGIHDIKTAADQADRVVAALDIDGKQGAWRLDSVIETVSLAQQLAASTKVRGDVRISKRDLILAPLRRELIPIVAPITFQADTLSLRPVKTNDVVLALTRIK